MKSESQRTGKENRAGSCHRGHADQLLAGRDDLAAQVTAGLAQVITGSLAGSNHDLAPYFAKALAWDIAEGVMDGHDEFRAVIKEWMLRLAS